MQAEVAKGTQPAAFWGQHWQLQQFWRRLTLSLVDRLAPLHAPLYVRMSST